MERLYDTGPGRVAGQTHNMTLYDLINFGYDVGLNDYPMWSPKTYPPGVEAGDMKDAWRSYINERIMDHFAFREIGCETPTQFIFYLNRRMRERMPSIIPVFSALENLSGDDIRRSSRFESASTAEQDNTTASDSKAYTSTNPRQTMVGKDPTEYYDTGTYSDGTTKGTGTSSTTDSGQTWGGYVTDATNRWWAGVNNALDLVFDAVEPCFSHIWKDHFNAF